MSDEAAATAVEPYTPPAAPIALLQDDEIRRIYRVAEAMYTSGAYKDLKNAEAAFAKMVIGRDLGLSPAQSMSGIHLVEGGVQMHYAMLGQFVRAREGYDYRPGWIKDEGPDEETLAVVWHDEEDPADFRDIVGAVVDFTVHGERRGVSRFTLDDARKANLIKEDKRAAWNTSPRNMLLARAMSNGVKWYVPEVLGGLPVYVEGELEGRERKSLTAGSADDDSGAGIELGPKVEKVIERATVLGHRGLSNRMAVEAAVGQRAPGVINDWVVRANEELARFAEEKNKTADADSAAEAEVQEEPVEPAAEEVTAGPEDVEEPTDDPRERLQGAADVEQQA